MHFDYVFSVAYLKASLHGIEQCRDNEKVNNLIRRFRVEEFRPKARLKVKLNESGGDEEEINDEYQQKCNELRSNLERYDQRKKKDASLNPIEFEKNDDTNLHMDFITACSNLRAENYDIKATDKHNVNFRLFITDRISQIARYDFFKFF